MEIDVKDLVGPVFFFFSHFFLIKASTVWVLIAVVSMSTVSACWASKCWSVWYVCSAVLSWAKQ